MHKTQPLPGGNRAPLARPALPGVLAVCALFVGLLLVTSCARAPQPGPNTSTASRDERLREIANEYADGGDLARAKADLGELGLANPAQYILSIAEADIAGGRSADEVEPLAKLAQGLGVISTRVQAYVAPVLASPTRMPPTATLPAPTATAAPSATATEGPPTAAPSPVPATGTPAPSPTAQAPRVLAGTDVNLRAGPDRVYPVVGRLRAGQEVAITGRNENGDWWQIEWTGSGQAWVAGTVVSVLGPIDTVTVAQSIPPRPTAAPKPTAAPAPAAPAPAPRANVDYRIVEQRMMTIDENGGCMGKHNIYVQVLDAGGAPVNGAVVQRVWANETSVSGDKDCPWSIGVTGNGCALFDVYSAGDNIRIVADPVLGSVSSETTRKLSTLDVDITVDELIATGYCPEGRENCEWRKNPGGNLPPQLCNGHYSWVVKFQRTR